MDDGSLQGSRHRRCVGVRLFWNEAVEEFIAQGAPCRTPLETATRRAQEALLLLAALCSGAGDTRLHRAPR